MIPTQVLKAHTAENVRNVANPHQFDPVEPKGPLQVNN